jgi:septum formation protein
MPADLILASSSPRRRELLAALGIPFTVYSADVDETLLPGEWPNLAVIRLASAKADSIAARFPTAIVLAADTLVIDPPITILGKPPHLTAAREMLHRLRGRMHQVITAVALRHPGAPELTILTTSVRMREYSDAEIEAYVASRDPLDKAGGYAIQYHDFRPVAAIEGCYTNVVGLPLCVVSLMLCNLGLPPDIAALALCNTYGNICPLAATVEGRR